MSRPAIKLYNFPRSGHAHRAELMLSLLQLPTELIFVDLAKGAHKTPEFLALNPFGQVPAIDDSGTIISDSNAILVYLAEKSGELLPQDPAARYQCLQWLMFQMGGIGPMFGQLGFFHKFAGKDYEDKRPRDRYVAESARLLGVLDKHLEGRTWIMGEQYSIADIATFPWVRNLIGFYEAGELVQFERFTNVRRVLEAFLQRPAVTAGLNIPARD